MKKVSIKIGKDKYEFGINKVKYFLGNNHELKRKMLMTIKEEFLKEANSEYSYEKNLNTALEINDEKVNLRATKFYEINDFYDFNDQLKLKTNSVILFYLTNIFRDIEYNETLNTINILIDQLSIEMNEILKEKNIYKRLEIKIDDINLKNIFKMVSLYMKKDDLKISQYDLTYEEKIISQIIMIEEIAKSSYEFKHLAILDIPHISENIIKYINNIETNNLSLIVNIPQNKLEGIELNQIISINRSVIDYLNEVDIYNNILLNLDMHYSMESISNVLENYFNDNDKNEQKINFMLDQII